MISAWWLIPIVLGAVAATVAVMAVMKAGSNADDVSEAFAEGARKGVADAKKAQTERDRAKRQAKAWLALAEIYRSRLENARAENAHLRVMAGLEQEGVE